MLDASAIALKYGRGDSFGQLQKAIEDAINRARAEERAACVRDILDRAYSCPGREAEWCRLIASQLAVRRACAR